MFNNQSNRRPGNPIVGIIVPILIYWGISFLVDVVVVAAYMTAHGQELMQAYESQSALQTFMEETMTFILGHSTEITSASALLALPFYIYMMRKDERYRKMFVEPEEHKTPWKAPAVSYVYTVLLGVTAGIALNNILILSNLGSISVSYQTTSAGLYAAPVIIEIIGLGVIVPVLEECLYRGVIFRRLRDLMPAKKAILFSAVIFAIIHGNIVQFLYALVFGLLLSYVYESFESIKAPIILHASANLGSVLLTEGNGYGWIFHTPLRMGMVTVICAFTASVFFVLIRNIENSKKMLQNY